MLKWIREELSGRAYNQMRMMTIILGPIFIVFGIAGLLGFGAIAFQGAILSGIANTTGNLLFIIIGIFTTYMRLTIFRETKTSKKQ